MKPLYIFDLDGTLALIDHRRHFVEGKVKRWDKFYEACDQDVPNTAVVTVFNHFLATADVVIFSGRGSEVRTKTIEWLTTHTNLCLPHAEKILVMRPERDYTPDQVLKKAWYNRVLNEVDRKRLVAVFDDRNKVVAMWRSIGVPCFQVAEGEF
jgi:hypothetical protein